MTLALDRLCAWCGIPADSGIFDDSSIRSAPGPHFGDEVVLASYQLHRNYCGVLMYFAQHVEGIDTPETKGFEWELRSNGTPLAPYGRFGHIINAWGISGFPVAIRLEEGALVELAVRRTEADEPFSHPLAEATHVSRTPTSSEGEPLQRVGGRIIGRYWYNTEFGGRPNQL